MDLACPLGPLLLPLLLMIGASPGLAALDPRENNAEICLLPPDEGFCRALFPRYYYDRFLQSCQQFMYGGCLGNANNFESLEACEDACGRIEKVPFPCRLIVHDRKCKESKEEYFFNLRTMTCEKIMSGLCNRNLNRFRDEATCKTFCAPKRSPSFCYSPRDSGLCSANITRYYFNTRHKVCEPFTYTGCGGNNNNFVNVMDCNRVCAKASQKEKKEKILKDFYPKRRLTVWRKKKH